jgi:hypothetical protein
MAPGRLESRRERLDTLTPVQPELCNWQRSVSLI